MKLFWGLIFFTVSHTLLIVSAYLLSKIIFIRFNRIAYKTEILLTSLMNYIILLLFSVIIPGLFGLLNLYMILGCIILEHVIIFFIYRYSKCDRAKPDFHNDLPAFRIIKKNYLRNMLQAAFYTSVAIYFFHAIFFSLNEHDCLVFQNAITINFLNDKNLLIQNADLWFYPHNVELMYLFNLLPFRQLYFTGFQNLPFLIAFHVLIYTVLRQFGTTKKTALLGLVILSIFITAQEFTSSLLFKNDTPLTTFFLFSLFFLVRYLRTDNQFYFGYFILSLGLLISVKATGILYAFIFILIFFILFLSYPKKRRVIGKIWKNWLVTGLLLLPVVIILNYQYIYNWLIIHNVFGLNINRLELIKSTSAFYSFFQNQNGMKNIFSFFKYFILGGFSLANIAFLYFSFRLMKKIGNKLAFTTLAFSFLLLILPLLFPFTGPPNLLFLGSLRFWQPFFTVCLVIYLYYCEKRKIRFQSTVFITFTTVIIVQNLLFFIVFKHGPNIIQYFTYIFRYLNFMFTSQQSYIYNCSTNNAFSGPSSPLWISVFFIMCFIVFTKNRLRIKFSFFADAKIQIKSFVVILVIVTLAMVFRSGVNYSFFRSNIFFFRMVQTRMITPAQYEYQDVMNNTGVLNYISQNVRNSNIYLSEKMETVFMWRFLVNDEYFTNNTYSYKLHYPVKNGKDVFLLLFYTEREKLQRTLKKSVLLFNDKYFSLYKLSMP